MQTTNSHPDYNMEISKIKNIIISLMPKAAWVARMYGHTYKNGSMVGKNFIALAIRQLYGYKNDEKFLDFIWETGIAEILGYKRKPHSTLLSKTRKYAEGGAIMQLYNEFIREKCHGKKLRIIAQDSVDIPAFFIKTDNEARLGHRTKKRREQNLDGMTGKDKKEKTFVFGYKLHIIQDAETSLPLACIIESAEVHDSQPFYKLFPYVVENFEIQYEAKFLGDSAFDSADIRKRIRDIQMKDVIAINGRGHYPSEIPKDKDYGKRWSVEQTNSVLELVYNLSSNRMKGLKRIIVNSFSCLLANFIEHFMN